MLLAPIVRWWCCKARCKSWSTGSCQDPKDILRQLQQKSAKVKKLLLNPSNPEPAIFVSSFRASSITSLLARWRIGDLSSFIVNSISKISFLCPKHTVPKRYSHENVVSLTTFDYLGILIFLGNDPLFNDYNTVSKLSAEQRATQ